MNKKTTKILIISLLILSIFAAAYYFFLKPEKKYTGKIKKVRLALSQLEATSLIRVALDQKYFKKYGIEIELTEQPLGRDSFNEMLNNNADLATVSESPIIRTTFERDDFKVLANIHTDTRNVKLLSKESNGVTDLIDVRGKRVGTPKGTVAEFFLYDLLDHVNLTFNDITLVDESVDELKKKFNSGEIDAVCLREPHIYRLSQGINEDDIFISYGKDNFLSTFNLVGRKDFIESNPEAVKRFLKALLDAEKFISENKEKAMEIVAKDLDLDKEYLFESCHGAKCNLVLNRELLLKMESEAYWLIQTQGFKQEEPDFLSFFELDLLESVNPGSTKTLR